MAENRPRSTDPPAGDDQPGVERAAAVRERAERIRARELAEALTRLEARGGLTPAQREAVEEMTDEIVDGILAPPAETIDAAPDGDTALVGRALHRLFVAESGDTPDSDDDGS